MWPIEIWVTEHFLNMTTLIIFKNSVVFYPSNQLHDLASFMQAPEVFVSIFLNEFWTKWHPWSFVAKSLYNCIYIKYTSNRNKRIRN